MSVSAAKGVAAEELGGLIDSSVNKEGLSHSFNSFHFIILRRVAIQHVDFQGALQ